MKTKALFAALLLLGMPLAVLHAAPVSSTFTSGDEQWRLVSTLGYNGPVTWVSSGGDPGAFIYGQDPDTGAFAFAAPDKFLHNQSNVYNHDLTFSIAAYQQPDGPLGWIGISGAGLEYVCQYAAPASPGQWYSRSILMRQDAGWFDPISYAVPTQAQFQAVLGNLDGLVIGAEFVNGLQNDITGLDSVNLVPEPGTLVLLAAGSIALLAWVWRRLT